MFGNYTGVVLEVLVVGIRAALGLWRFACRIRLCSASCRRRQRGAVVGPLLSLGNPRRLLLTPGPGLAGVVRVLILFLSSRGRRYGIQPSRSAEPPFHPDLFSARGGGGNHTLGVLGMIIRADGDDPPGRCACSLAPGRGARRSLPSDARRPGGEPRR